MIQIHKVKILVAVLVVTILVIFLFFSQTLTGSRVENDIRVVSLALDEYFSICNAYPPRLKFLLEQPDDCPDWKKSKFVDEIGEARLLRDPWGFDYSYLTDRKNVYEVKSLGSDGRPGGTGVAADVFVSGPARN